MSPGGSLSLVFVLSVVSVLIVRSREVSWWQAVLIFLCGFYMALSPAMEVILIVVQSVTGRL